jgi:hypothetical protein
VDQHRSRAARRLSRCARELRAPQREPQCGESANWRGTQPVDSAPRRGG